MVIDPVVDTIIVVTFLITALKTIYHNCIKIDKGKKYDNLKDDNVIERKSENVIERRSENVIEKKRILKSNQSLSNLNLFYNDKDDDEESNIPILSPIQKSYECFQCHKKLAGFYKKDYFAFDKEYCKICWNKIHFKIINNHS